jgi:hypothetical protein
LNHVIWCLVVWNLWMCLNKIICGGWRGRADCKEVMPNIKTLSWFWFMFRGRHLGLKLIFPLCLDWIDGVRWNEIKMEWKNRMNFISYLHLLLNLFPFNLGGYKWWNVKLVHLLFKIYIQTMEWKINFIPLHSIQFYFIPLRFILLYTINPNTNVYGLNNIIVVSGELIN